MQRHGLLLENACFFPSPLTYVPVRSTVSLRFTKFHRLVANAMAFLYPDNEDVTAHLCGAEQALIQAHSFVAVINDPCEAESANFFFDYANFVMSIRGGLDISPEILEPAIRAIRDYIPAPPAQHPVLEGLSKLEEEVQSCKLEKCQGAVQL